jgi:threonine/homoserine/homoserine lactone efflux protein
MPEVLGVAVTWWLVSLSGVLMPGPLGALAISEGARRGVIAGVLITVGHAVAELAILILLGVGVASVLRRPVVVGSVGVLGGAVLAWMGWGIVSAAWRDLLDPPRGSAAAGAGRTLMRAGLLTTIGNPYWLLWWLTVGASYFIAFNRFGLPALITLFFFGHLSLDLGWNAFLAFAVGSGRGRVRRNVYRGVLAICGVFVIAMSGYFVVSGVRFLRGL